MWLLNVSLISIVWINGELLPYWLKPRMLVALRFAKDVGVTCLEVDICYKELFGLIQNGSPCLASNGDVIDDICCWFSSFHLINHTFIPTSCNRASHVQGGTKALWLFEHVWSEESLAFIICIVRFCLIKQVAIVSIKKKKKENESLFNNKVMKFIENKYFF